MQTPTIKPSARIAARQKPLDLQLSGRIGKLRELSWNINGICDAVDKAVKDMRLIVSVDTFSLVQQQRGEIGVMRDLLKANAEFMQEAVNDGSMDSDARSSAYALIHQTKEAILQSFKNAGLLKGRHD